jgi:aryl-phospho-beta-D-glucosidase BglC (GH1 family)
LTWLDADPVLAAMPSLRRRILGYNTIRIPFSDQMVEGTKVPNQISFYGSTGPINTDLQGLTSMQILDKIIDYAGSLGLKVILDNHRSEAFGLPGTWTTNDAAPTAFTLHGSACG